MQQKALYVAKKKERKERIINFKCIAHQKKKKNEYRNILKENNLIACKRIFEGNK